MAFWAIAAGVVASIGLLLFSAAAPHLSTEPTARLRVILPLLRREPLVLGACVTVIIATLGESIVNFLVPLQLDEHGVSATTIGVYFAAGSVLFVVAGAVVARFADKTVRLLVSGVASVTLVVLLTPLIGSDALAVLVSVLILRMAVLGVLWTIAFPLGGLGATRAGLASGAIFGVLMTTIGVCNIVGTLVAGLLADGPGFWAAYVLLAATCAVGALVLLRLALRPRPDRVVPTAAV